MTMTDLAILYLVVGVACGVAVARRTDGPRRDALLAAAITVVLWPLWAPFVLLQPPQRSPGACRRAERPGGAPRAILPVEQRIDSSLAAALEAARHAGLAQLLPEDSARHIQEVAARVAGRLGELDQQLDGLRVEPDQAAGRLTIQPRGTSDRAMAAAQRRARSLERLQSLRDQDVRALDELAELCELLRAELTLARYGASEDLGEITSELWARLEGLSAIADPTL
jgi:hypothetical protein